MEHSPAICLLVTLWLLLHYISRIEQQQQTVLSAKPVIQEYFHI